MKLTEVVCIDIALCVMVHDVEFSPSLTTRLFQLEYLSNIQVNYLKKSY